MTDPVSAYAGKWALGKARRHGPAIIAVIALVLAVAIVMVLGIATGGSVSTAAQSVEDDTSAPCVGPTTIPPTTVPPTGVGADPAAVVAARAAQARGFTGQDLIVAVAVAGAESGWVADIIGGPNDNGTYDYGLWQINTIHEELLAGGDWKDPGYNAYMAYEIWSDAAGWTPWVTWQTGAYEAYLDRAAAAVAAAGGGGCGGPPLGDPGVLRDRAEAISAAINAGELDPFYGDTDDYWRMCGRLAARIHSHRTSGYYSAIVQWNAMVLEGKAHPGDMNPPAGVNVFFASTPFGHVGVHLGNGVVVSNDIGDSQSGLTGGVYITTLEDHINGAWSLPYLGWAPPEYRTPVDPGDQG